MGTVELLRVLLVGVGTRGKHWARIMHDEPLCRTVGYMDLNMASLADVNDRWPAPAGALFYRSWRGVGCHRT